MGRIQTFFSKQYHALVHIRDTPHAIAGGIAIGVILGFTPFFGFKTLLAVLLAWFLGCSKLSAALAVTFHDLLLPVWPVVLRWQYNIGYWLVHHPHQWPAQISLKNLKLAHWFHWKTLALLWPLTVGSLVVALPLGLLFYYLALIIVTKAHTARDAKLKLPPPRTD